MSKYIFRLTIDTGESYYVTKEYSEPKEITDVALDIYFTNLLRADCGTYISARYIKTFKHIAG